MENQAQDEVASHVDEATDLQENSDGEEVSHEEQQHQADIESKNMAAKQQKVQPGSAVAKAIADATEAVEKASAETQNYNAETVKVATARCPAE